MRHFQITEPPTPAFIKLALQKYQASEAEMSRADHPQEDYLSISKQYPIFVVADGVTLIQNIIDHKPYPNPSPAGDVAQIFCETLIRAAEERYTSFTVGDITEIFKEANEAVRAYNQKLGRTKESIDYWDTDFYAATTAFAIIKDPTVYWGSICDSYVVHFDKNGANKFQSPVCHTKTQAKPPQYTGNPDDQKLKAQHIWHHTRNGVNEEGQLTGYGVVTGEDNAIKYLNFGSFALHKDEVVIILTDGFEEYLKLPEFVSLFTRWPESLQVDFKNLTSLKTQENPDDFGHERSLIALSL